MPTDSVSVTPGNAGLARSAVQHATAVFGGGAVALYLLGVVSTVGQIRATHLEVTRVMPLIPLEAHLRNGVGIVASPMFSLIVCGYTLMYLGTKGSYTAAIPNSRALRTWDNRVYPTLVAFIALWAFFVLPWPFILLLIIVISSVVAPIALQPYLNDTWRDRPVEVYVICSVISLIAISFLDAYFRSDPFPNARIATDHRRFEGPMIVSSDGLVYLGPTDRGQLYAAVATDQVNSLTTTPQHHPDEPSLLNLAGLDWPRDR